MKLRRLRIDRLPGIEPGFAVDDIGPGINLVIGPNASGKSSLLRALRAALYREEARQQQVSVRAVFEDASGELEAERLGDDLQWRRAGRRVDPPALPEHRLLPCYTLHLEDLLAADADTDRAIAAGLARELAGGYDLRALREDFTLKQHHGRAEANALQQADLELHQAHREQQALQADEAQLADLRERKDAAQAALERLSLLEAALDLLTLRRELKLLQERLAALPPGLDRLRGDEADALDKLAARRDSQRGEIAEAEHALTQAAEALTDSGLADSTLSLASLDEYRIAARRLGELERELARLRERKRAADSARDLAQREMGGEPAQAVQLSPAAIRSFETQLAERRGLLAEQDFLRRELARLDAGETAVLNEDALRRAREALRDWLASPAAASWTGLRRLAALAVLIPALLGISLTAWRLHWGLLALLLPFGWGCFTLLGRREDGGRAASQARFAESGLAAPRNWQGAAVRRRLDDLDRELLAIERQRQEASQQQARRRELEACQASLAAVDRALADVAGEVGYDPAALDLSLDRWRHLTAAYDKAQIECESLQRNLNSVEAERQAQFERLRAFLATVDASPLPADANHELIDGRLRQLAERCRQRDQAQSEQRRAQQDIARCRTALADTEATITALYQRAGVDPGERESLRQRLACLNEWRELRQALRDTETLRAREQARLAGAEDLLARLDAEEAIEPALRREQDELRTLAASHESLVEEIAAIGERLRHAGLARRLENSRAARQHAEDALRGCLNEALQAAAGGFLLAEVEADYIRDSQPRALRRAADWFGRFTRHEYALRFDPAADRFEAEDCRSGHLLPLKALSSGTRMQLLLAVRIAFALEAEQGRVALPLVLDEALTTADPLRFRAIADALCLLAVEEGRQIFYLSAQPEDLRHWQAAQPAPHYIDLGALRRGQAAVPDPALLQPAPAPRIPAPGALNAEDYALRLGVPALEPWREPAAIHLFHLLRDQLPLLQRLLELGVSHLGQLDALLAAQHVDLLLDPAQGRGLKARVAGAAAWLSAWRIGRGQPVDRSAIEASGAVTARFLDEVVSLAQALDGDGRALVAALEAGEVKGFRQSSREELAAWLRESGFIDDRAQLEPAELRLRVAAALREELDAEADSLGEAGLLIRGLEAGLMKPSETVDGATVV